MRLITITPVLIAAALAVSLAAARPAHSQTYDPAFERQRAVAAQAQRDAARASQDFLREQRARDARARTEATLRAMQSTRSDELAGGPPPYSPYQPSAIAPMEPPRTVTPLPLNAEQARMDALMAEALARSNARVKAASSGGNR